MPKTSIYNWLNVMISTYFFDSSSKLTLINFSLNADVNSSIHITYIILTAMLILALFENKVLSLFIGLPSSNSLSQLVPRFPPLFFTSRVRLLRTHMLSVSRWSTCWSPSLYPLSLTFFLRTFSSHIVILNRWLRPFGLVILD